MPDTTGRPCPSDLFEPLLVTLGRETGFKPGVTVSLNCVVPKVLTLHGIDLNTTPFDRVRKDKSDPVGLDRRVIDAYKKLRRDDYSYVRKHGVLTVAGSPRRWALTEEGVARARAIISGRKPVRKNRKPANATAAWLQKRLTHPLGIQHSDLYQRMYQAISLKCPVSASSDQIDDHIMECIARMIHRDSLRSRIEEGKSLTVSHIVAYAVRSAWTDARNSGTNPVARTLYGARTETERRKRREQPDITARPTYAGQTSDLVVGMAGTANMVCYSYDEAGNRSIRDIAAANHEAIENTVFFETLWKRVTATVEKGKPKVFERYLEILSLKLQGEGTGDIADVMGVSKSRASSMIAEARRVLRAAREQGRLVDI